MIENKKVKLLGQYEIYEKKLVHIWSSIKDAALANKMGTTNISAAIKKGCIANHYYWGYFEIDEKDILNAINK